MSGDGSDSGGGWRRRVAMVELVKAAMFGRWTGGGAAGEILPLMNEKKRTHENLCSFVFSSSFPSS